MKRMDWMKAALGGLLAVCAACSDGEDATGVMNKPEEKLPVVMVVPDFVTDVVTDGTEQADEQQTMATRGSYTAIGADEHFRVAFAWEKGDAVGVFPAENYQTMFAVGLQPDGVSASSARFNGGSWALKGGMDYFAYYPFVKDMALNKADIPVDFNGQRQAGNGSTAHLAAKDFMWARAKAPMEGNPEVVFDLQHLGCVVELNVALPQAMAVEDVVLTVDEPVFMTEGKVNLTEASPRVKGGAWQQFVRLELTEMPKVKELKAYLMVPPANLTGKRVKVKVDNATEGYEAVLSARQLMNMVPGKAYVLQVNSLEKSVR